MLKNKINILLIVTFVCTTNFVFSQSDIPYKLNTSLSFGYSYFASSISSRKLNRFQPNSSVKIMWKPEHLLSVGIETGYIFLYTLEKDDFINEEFGTTDVRVSMSAIPFFLSFSMKLSENFDLNGGIGGYLILTNIDAFENKVISSGWSTGYNIGADYFYSYTEDLKIGTEIKAYYISKLESASIGLNFFLRYNIYSY